MEGKLLAVNWVMYLLTKVHGGHFLFDDPVEYKEMLVISGISPVATYKVWPLPWTVVLEHHKMHRHYANDPSVELRILERHSLKALDEMPWEVGAKIPATLMIQSYEADQASK